MQGGFSQAFAVFRIDAEFYSLSNVVFVAGVKSVLLSIHYYNLESTNREKYEQQKLTLSIKGVVGLKAGGSFTLT